MPASLNILMTYTDTDKLTNPDTKPAVFDLRYHMLCGYHMCERKP